jgi:hypothetical protein
VSPSFFRSLPLFSLSTLAAWRKKERRTRSNTYIASGCPTRDTHALDASIPVTCRKLACFHGSRFFSSAAESEDAQCGAIGTVMFPWEDDVRANSSSSG